MLLWMLAAMTAAAHAIAEERKEKLTAQEKDADVLSEKE